MKISYEMNKTVLTTGMNQHFKYKGKAWLVVWLIIACFLLYFGISMLYSHADKGLGIFCCLGSLIFFFRRKLAIWKSVRRSFHGKPSSQEITMNATPDKLVISSLESNGAAKWSNFMDVKVCEQGILLYTQKNLFNWIPKSEVDGGTWDEFAELVEQQVSLSTKAKQL